MAKKTALITGASSGIGYELAKIFAREGYDLVLVARSQAQLQLVAAELQKSHGTISNVIVKDLSDPKASDELFSETEQKAITIEVLVNSAGFANYGYLTETDKVKELELLELNIVALTLLTKLFLPGMKARGGGYILNLGSTASFFAGPLMATYYASKNYVLSFSAAINVEMEGTGVSVTALCPGPTVSGFQKRAAIADSKMLRGKMMDAKVVAEIGYMALMRRKAVVVPGLSNQIITLLTRFVPRSIATKLVLTNQQRIES